MQVLGTEAARQPGGVVYRHGEDERLVQNAKNLLKSLYVLVSSEKDPPALLTAAPNQVLETLRRM